MTDIWQETNASLKSNFEFDVEPINKYDSSKFGQLPETLMLKDYDEYDDLKTG